MEGKDIDSADQKIKDEVEERSVMEDDDTAKGVNRDDNDGAYTDTLVEDIESENSRWRRIYILIYTIFVVCLGHSVTFPSLWPFLTSLDPQVSVLFLGGIYSVRSVTELASSLVHGRWCNNQVSIEISTAVFVIANLMYAFAESAGEMGIWVIISSRILLGFSAGGIFFAGRIEASEWAKPYEMAKVMNMLGMWEWIGFLAGPVLQAAISLMGANAIHVSRTNFYLNMYTAPTYIIILLGVTGLILQLAILHRSEVKPEQKTDKKEEKDDENSPGVKVDILGALLLLFIHFSLLSSYIIIETTFTPLLMAIFGWGRELTIRYGGFLMSAHFLLGIFSFTIIPKLTNKFSGRKIMLVLLIICLINFFIFLPWGPGRLDDKLYAPADGIGAMITKQDGGCLDAYIWCDNTPNLPFIQFLVALFIDGVITPMAFAMVIILYTKVLGQLRVENYIGWYHGTESFAKIACPLFSVLLFYRFGLRGTFGCLVVIVALDVILLLIMWRRIVPFDEQPAQYEVLTAQNDASSE